MTRTIPFLAVLAACDDGMLPVGVDGDGGAAHAAWESADGRRREAFRWGDDARTPITDTLFVLDGSVSMVRVIDRVRQGFAGLQPSDFPAEARIAVMSATPGREKELQPARGRLQYELDPAVGSRRLARLDPGFLSLVDGRGITSLIDREPRAAEVYPHAGCDAWFTPDATNRAGVPCIVAHTQSLLVATRAEAGLTAFAQLLDRQGGEPLFRPGAAVNVVFVSDTHDPGLVGAAGRALLAERPTAADLVARIDRDNVVSSVRFHAIAPETECVERWAPLGASYTHAAEATGGVVLDLCTATDYRPVLQRTFDEGARPTRPRLPLGAVAEHVDEVRLDGSPTPFTLAPGGRVIEVPALTGIASADVEVTFTRKDERRLPRRQRAQQPH